MKTSRIFKIVRRSAVMGISSFLCLQAQAQETNPILCLVGKADFRAHHSFGLDKEKRNTRFELNGASAYIGTGNSDSIIKDDESKVHRANNVVYSDVSSAAYSNRAFNRGINIEALLTFTTTGTKENSAKPLEVMLSYDGYDKEFSASISRVNTTLQERAQFLAQNYREYKSWNMVGTSGYFGGASTPFEKRDLTKSPMFEYSVDILNPHLNSNVFKVDGLSIGCALKEKIQNLTDIVEPSQQTLEENYRFDFSFESALKKLQ